MSMALNISDLILSLQDTEKEPYERGPSLTFGVFFTLISVTWLLEEPLRRRPSACCRRLPVLGLYQVRVDSELTSPSPSPKSKSKIPKRERGF